MSRVNDDADVEVDMSEKTSREKALLGLMKAGVIDKNEVRVMLGLEPVEEVGRRTLPDELHDALAALVKEHGQLDSRAMLKMLPPEVRALAPDSPSSLGNYIGHDTRWKRGRRTNQVRRWTLA